MKTSMLISAFAMASSVLSLVPATARPMHAGMDYSRYLEEIDSVQDDLDRWKAAFGDIAQANGLMPVSEERSADDQEEDLRQRIFLSRQDVEIAQAANPEANFSIMSPFSSMTKDEFRSKMFNSYVQGNATDTGERKLRAQLDFTTTQELIQELIANIQAAGTVQPADSASDAIADEADTTTDMSSTFATRRPRPTTVAPSTTPTSTTSKPTTPTPTTATPSPTTKAPVVEPITTQPTSTTSTTSTPATTEEAIVSDGDSVDWSTSACMSPVQSQGQCGSCWAFASVAAVESAACIANGQSGLTKYSEQQLVSCDSQDWGCSGGAPVYAFQYIQENGLCSEDSYPYASSTGYSSSCSASCTSTDTGITGYEKIDSGDEDALISALDEHPVVVAVASGNEAWKQYTGGVLSTCDTTELDHAVLAVGYDSSNLKIRNSWGSYWGEDGYIRLKRSSSGTGTCGVLTDMSYPLM